MANPRKKKPLTAARIVQAGVGLADQKGVEHVTMRKVASKLRVEAMSLYHHVGNKDALLDGMVDAVFSEVEVPRAKDWRTAMRERAASLRAALTRHPWATPLLDSRAAPGPATLAHHDAVIACLREAGFSWALTARAFSLMDSYIYGFCLQEHALPVETAAEGDWEGMVGKMLEALPEDLYPALAAFTREHVMQPHFDHAAEFDEGLALILDALERAR